jgi:hypothetical protein
MFDVDQVVWRQFAEAATPEAFYRSWLAVQARLIQGVRRGETVERLQSLLDLVATALAQERFHGTAVGFTMLRSLGGGTVRSA